MCPLGYSAPRREPIRHHAHAARALVGRRLHHAQPGRVAPFVLADGADAAFGEGMAALAMAYRLHGRGQGTGQLPRAVLVALHGDADGRAALELGRMLRLDPVADADYDLTRDCDRRAAPWTP